MSPVEEKTVRISVRELVEFILKEGDIDNRISGGMDREAMLQGGRIHRKIQRRMGSDYHAEVPLKISVPCEDFVIRLEGRADGIISRVENGKERITVDEIKSGAYLEKMKPISAVNWITPDSVPTVVAYGAHDRVQPFRASLRLKSVLEENGVDHRYFELAHSGHGLQNDNAVYRKWMEAVEAYLDKYMPVN